MASTSISRSRDVSRHFLLVSHVGSKSSSNMSHAAFLNPYPTRNSDPFEFSAVEVRSFIGMLGNT